MKHTIMKDLWAQPGKQWEGFRLVGYSLFSKTLQLALTEVKPNPDGKKEEPTTVGEIYTRLGGRSVKFAGDGRLSSEWLERLSGCMKIKTDAAELVVAGLPFNLDVLRELLSLWNDGLNPLQTSWFWYDRDSVTDDLHDSYSFFVVCGDRIVRERVTFYDHSRSGFDPSVFKADDSTEDGLPIWSSEPEWAEARQRFWRRKFYKETSTGQLQALRDDRPDLWVFRDEYRPAAEATLSLVKGIFTLLWFVLALLVLIVIRLWK